MVGMFHFEKKRLSGGIPQDEIRFHTCGASGVAGAKLRALVEGARLASQRLF
jgi:hypothetical protein